jgi:opacity protein-like surface antigen
MRHLAWAIVLASSAAVSSARAQDSVSYDWSGFYIGAHLGGGLALTDIDDPFGPSLYGDTVRSAGPIAGAQAGYNWQFGRTLLGLETDVSWTDLYGTDTCFASSGFYVSANCSSQIDALGTLAARLGWLIGPDAGTLLYGKAGAAWMHQDVDATANGGAGTPTTTADGFHWGWMLGAGAERALSRRWSLRGEYDFLSFGSDGLATPQSFFQPVVSVDPNAVTPVASAATDFSSGTHLFKIGLNYRLGEAGSDEAPLPVSPPLAGTTLEIGARYVYGWGRFQKDLGNVNLASLDSRLTYSDMTTNGAELFARLDLANGLMAKGFIGRGSGTGKLNDEDWAVPFPAAFVPYSNTWSAVDDEIQYGVIDVGYDVWRDTQFRVAPFIGYSQFHQYMEAHGCVQLANPNSDCVPTIPVDVNAIIEDDTWHALRLGVAADIEIVPGVTLTADAAYLPYLRITGVDNHLLRALVSPEWANGTGAQLELILAYAVTEQLKIGVGGRYWNMWTADGTVNFGGQQLAPMRFSVEQAALLVQGSYTFDGSD